MAVEHAHGRGGVDRFRVARVEHELIYHGHMFLQPGIVGDPALPAVGALVDRIEHRAGINGGWVQGVDRQTQDTIGAEICGHALPSCAAIASFVDRLVGGDIDDAGIRRMERDRNDRIGLLAAGGQCQNHTDRRS